MRIGRYDFLDNGYFFTKASFPQSVSNSLDGSNNISIENLENLKKGISVARSFFNLVAIGDASIDKAVKDAEITKISYIDVNEKTIFIFFRKITVNVYGE